MKVTTTTNGNPKVRRLDSFIGLIPNMAVTLLLFIIFLVLARLGSKLFNRLFKTSNNKALEQLFSL
jgi:small conductance mechanosensitive channel